MQQPISIFINGEPKPQLRPRAFVLHGHARVYNPKTAEGWKSQIADALRNHVPAQPITGPVCLDLTFYFPRPKGHYGTGKNELRLKPNAPRMHTQKPDRDNLDKPFLDCLKTLGVFGDDAQVCDGSIKKLWCPPGIQPGCQMTLVPLEESQETEEQKEMFSPKEERGLLV